MKKHILLTVLILLSIIPKSEAQNVSIHHDRLPNGLTYYICKDNSEKGMANFYLLQNVGAILEQDNENGLAHYLEHMAFNATEHFPQGVMAYLRGKGIYTFNAHTGINETVYQINSIPVGNEELIQSSVHILKDWCNGIMLTPKDVEKERKIIIAEWRDTRNLQRLIEESVAPTIYNHSKYASRNIIGDLNVLNRFTAKDIQAFYKRWYKPELQCVVVVGDVDVNKMEQLIKTTLSSIPKSAQDIARTNIPIADNSTPLYYRFVDSQNVTPSVGVYQRIPSEKLLDGKQQYQLNAYINMFNKLVAGRISFLRNENKENFIAAFQNLAPFVRGYYQISWEFTPYQGKEKEALQQIMDIRKSILTQGFHEDEFNQVKQEFYEGMKELLSEENLGTPDDYLEMCKNNYLRNTPIMSLREMFTLLSETIIETEVNDFNQWIQETMNQNANISFITYSSSEKQLQVSEQQFMTALNNSTPLHFESEPLSTLKNISVTPAVKGKIVKEEIVEELEGAKKWTLSNGGQVIYKHLPSMNNAFYFVGSGLGGKSIIRPKDIPAFTAMTDLIMKSGVGNYSRNQLSQWLQNADFDLSLSISDYSVGLGSTVSHTNALFFFNYLYMVICEQRFDKNVFQKYIERKKYSCRNRASIGLEAIQDTIQSLMYPYTPENPKEDVAFYESIRYEDLPRLYHETFADASRFTYCILGDIPESEARSLTETYLGAIPGNPNEEKPALKPIDHSAPDSSIMRLFWADIDDDIGELEISYSRNTRLSPKEELSLAVFEQLLQQTLFDELREKEQGIYGVSVKAQYKSHVTDLATLNIHFRSHREKIDLMNRKTKQIIADIKSGKVSEERIKQIKIPMMVEEQMEDSYNAEDEKQTDLDPTLWLSLINAYMEQGSLPDTVASTKSNYELLNEIVKKDIIDIANKVTDNAKYREFVVKSIPKEKREWKH